MSDISIIIPSKDRLWSLPKAVESCRSAKLAVQIIVVDDASSDGTAEWLAAQPDVLAVQGNGWGKPWAVNRALPFANGKYLRYLDSDDWLNPGANEAQFEIAEREEADIVVSGLDLYEDERFVRRLEWRDTDDFIAQQLGESEFGSHYSAFLFRRAFVADIPHRTLFPASDFASRDDRCMVLEAALRKPRISVCAVPALCHRTHARGRLQFRDGLSGAGTYIQQLHIYRRILALLEQDGELTARRKRAAVKVLWPLAHWVAYSHPQDAKAIVDWIYELEPDFTPPQNGALGLMYRQLGFSRTEQILRVRRNLLKLAGRSAKSA